MLALIVAIVAVILLLPSCGGNSSKKAGDVESTTLVKAGDKAPDFTVEMFGGGKTDLAELKGKVVLLNFWATWCPPCRQELARVQSDVIDRFAGRDFVFLPICARRNAPDRGGVPRKDRLLLPDGSRPLADRLRPLCVELHSA